MLKTVALFPVRLFVFCVKGIVAILLCASPGLGIAAVFFYGMQGLERLNVWPREVDQYARLESIQREIAGEECRFYTRREMLLLEYKQTKDRIEREEKEHRELWARIDGETK